MAIIVGDKVLDLGLGRIVKLVAPNEVVRNLAQLGIGSFAVGVRRDASAPCDVL